MNALFLLLTATAAFAESPVSVTKRPSPDKALIFEVTIPAPSAAVWQAFSTTEGLVTWLAPAATLDLRQGGDWIVRFAASTGGGTILSFTPGKEITIAALAPDQFPNVRAQRTNARFEFIDRGQTTLVRLTQSGWKTGAEWDQAYDYLADGNRQLLEALHRRFVSGPIDWSK